MVLLGNSEESLHDNLKELDKMLTKWEKRMNQYNIKDDRGFKWISASMEGAEEEDKAEGVQCHSNAHTVYGSSMAAKLTSGIIHTAHGKEDEDA